MTKAQVLGLIQSLLSAVGGFLVIKGLPDGTLTTGVGVVMGLVGLVWSFFDKSATVSSIEEGLRQVGAFVGGIFIAKGKLSVDQLNTWLGLITTLVPLILSFFAKSPTSPAAQLASMKAAATQKAA